MAQIDDPNARQEAPYGFRRVPTAEKQGLVDSVFHRVARRYDLMNDLMSGGLHRVWKDAMIAWLAPPRQPRSDYRVLDVAGGTGDIAFRVSSASGGAARVVVCDINEAMLRVGADRAARRHREAVSFVRANAEALPFPDRSQTAYLVAFGIRNVPRREQALAEAARVLKPGGRFLCLEFAPVEMPVLDRVYDAYSFGVIPRIGRLVTGDAEPYQYLVESIRTFPNPGRFAAELELAGFSRVSWRLYAGGIAAIHSAFLL